MGRAGRNIGRANMDHLLKGGVLWLLGVPFVGVVAAYMFGWI